MTSQSEFKNELKNLRSQTAHRGVRIENVAGLWQLLKGQSDKILLLGLKGQSDKIILLVQKLGFTTPCYFSVSFPTRSKNFRTL